MEPMKIVEQSTIYERGEMVDSKRIPHNQIKKFGSVKSVKSLLNKDKLKTVCTVTASSEPPTSQCQTERDT